MDWRAHPATVTPAVTAKRVITERAIIEANMERIAHVRGEHRSNIEETRLARLRALLFSACSETEQAITPRACAYLSARVSAGNLVGNQ